MSIQDSVNSIINQVATISTINKVAKEGRELRSDIKQSSKDIKGSIEGLTSKITTKQLDAKVEQLKKELNPNFVNAILSARDREGFSSPQMKEIITKQRQSMMERTQTLTKQKQDVPKIKEELRIGKQKINPDSPLYQKIMSQMEERDGK